MVLRDLQRLVNTFFDGNRRHHNDKLGEAIAFVQLEDAADIDIGLARAGFHFDGEVTRCQRCGWTQAIAKLDVIQVG